MTDDKIIELLQEEASTKHAVDVAELLSSQLQDGLTESALIFYFARAFPDIPISTLRDLEDWERFPNGRMTDREFNEALDGWLSLSSEGKNEA